MGLPQLARAAGRWLIGRDQADNGRVLTDNGYNPAQEAKAFGELMSLLATDLDRKLGIQHNKNWADYAKSYGSYGWLFACVSKIAQAFSSIPIRAYQLRDGELVEKPDSDLGELLRNVNPDGDWPRLAYFIAVDMQLCGNQYLHMARAKGGKRKIRELWRLRPDRMTIMPGKQRVEGYKYKVNEKEYKFDADEVAHSMFPDPNSDFYGIGPMNAAQDAADVDSYVIETNRALLKHGASPRHLLSFDAENQMGEEEAKKWAKTFDELHSRGGAHRTTAIKGASLEPMEWKPKDMEYQALRSMGREEICAIFKTPLAILGVEEHSKYTLHEYRKIFWEDCIMPLAGMVEGSLNEFLAPNFGPSWRVGFDVSQVPALQRNLHEEGRFLLEQVQGRVMLPNEMRALLPEIYDGPLPASVGNVFWGTLNEVPLVQVPENGQPVKSLNARVTAERPPLLLGDGQKKVMRPHGRT